MSVRRCILLGGVWGILALSPAVAQAPAGQSVAIDPLIQYLQNISKKQPSIDKSLLQSSILHQKVCSCSNGYACEPPDHIPPACGSCTCIDLP